MYKKILYTWIIFLEPRDSTPIEDHLLSTLSYNIFFPSENMKMKMRVLTREFLLYFDRSELKFVWQVIFDRSETI